MSSPVRITDMSGETLSPTMQSTYFDGASVTKKEFRNWRPPMGSPDSELGPERDALVSRTRDMEKNNGLTSGLQQTYEDNIIGVQFKLSCNPAYEALGRDKKWATEWSKKVEGLFEIYADSTEIDASRMNNFQGLTKLMLSAGMGPGEGLALPLWMRDRATHTAFHLVDADRLSEPTSIPNSRYMRDGIEVNDYDEPLAYHIQKSNPNDQYMMFNTLDEWVRVPARTPDGMRKRVIHLYAQKRPGQHRAPPGLVSIMGDMKMFDTYRKTELTSAISNSLISAFIKTSMSSDDVATMFDAKYESFNNERNQWLSKLQAGAIISLFPGDELQSFTPSRPATAYAAYTENMLRTMAAGANVPYELLLKDFTQTSYSSARASILEAWRFFLGRRRWLSDGWATPVFDLWLEEMVNKGIIDAPGFYEMRGAYTRCSWIGGGRGWIDEFKEANAAKLRIDTGLSTLESECEKQGSRWDEVMEQRAIELVKRKELEEKYDIKFPDPQGLIPGDPEDDTDMNTDNDLPPGKVGDKKKKEDSENQAEALRFAGFG